MSASYKKELSKQAEARIAAAMRAPAQNTAPQCVCLLCFITLFFGALLFPSPAAAISDFELIRQLKGAGGGTEESFFAAIAFTEIDRIFSGRFGDASEGTLTGYYIPDRYITKFFFNHSFFWFIMSWNGNPEQFYFIAVNNESLTPFLLLGDPETRGKSEEKLLNVSSNAFFAHELNLENLNTVIRSENISINDNNLKSYVQEVFGILGIDCYGGIYVNWHYVVNSRIGGIEKDVTDSMAGMYEYLLLKGNGMYVSPLDGGAFQIIILSWINRTGEVLEWNFTVNKNGTIEMNDIRDMAM
jgi:hypothetical protein